MTFTMVSMEMKMDLTMIHFIPTMADKMHSNGESLLPKTSSSEEIEEKNICTPQWVSECLFYA